MPDRAPDSAFNALILPSSPWRPAGTLQNLCLRIPGSDTPQSAPEVIAVVERGILGDRHAQQLSPRQVLLAGTDAYRDLQLPPFTLSENLLIDLPTAGLHSGSLLKIGPEVVLWITFQCEPCSQLERRRPGVVKALRGRRGVLARVLQGGSMRVGDVVCQGPAPIPPMSNDWKARVVHVVRQIPAGKRVEYRQLADLAGVAKGYCRAFPRVLHQLCPDVARRAQTSSVVMQAEQRWAGTELFDVCAYLSTPATPHADGHAVHETRSG